MLKKEFKLNCIFDNKSYNMKPLKNDMSSINNRLMTQKEQTLSINEFMLNVANGKSYLSGRIIDKSLGRKANNFKDINFFSLDVDNDTDIKYTQKQAREAIKDVVGVTPLFIYRTFTGFNEDGSERFRMVYGLENEVDANTIKTIISLILEKTGDIFDKACVDANRMFLGTNLKETTRMNINATSKPLVLFTMPILLTDTKINELVMEKEKKDADIKEAIKIVRLENIAKYKNSTNSGNGEFNEDAIYQLQQIDIHDYLGVDSGKNNICCPIHDGKDKNFSIYYKGGMWKTACHSHGCIKGGSIIDLHMALNNIDAGQSIKELCQMYNIEQFNPSQVVISAKKTTNFIVNKYISENKKVLDAILNIVKTNNKILLTGAMGCGKTHFICNELYEYGQSICKKVVVVIPGVAQLENLQENKGVHIVCGGNPFDEEHNSSVIATTPESLPKVVEVLGDNNFILVVDESHERITSLSYRTGYKADNIGKAEKLAHKNIHLTATTTTLIGDKFDEVIKVTSRAVITNKVKIIKVPSKNYSDAIFTFTKNELEEGRKPILFNENIKQNKEIKELLEVKNQVVVYEYEEEKQQNLFGFELPNKIIKNEFLTSAESVNSKSKSENIKNGTVKADVTLLTSAVLAGVDLASKPKNILIVGCKGMMIDNIIQLIGRFRSGIDVVLVVSEHETKKEYFDFDFICHSRLEGSQQLANCINTNPGIKSLYEDGVAKSANINFIGDKWGINPPEIVAKVYENWSRAVLYNPEKLAGILKKQDAFKVDGNITIEEYTEPVGTVLADIAKAKKEERKEIIETSKKVLLEQDDSTLEKLLNKGLLKHIDDISPEILEQAVEWHEAAEAHIEKINLIARELFKDDEGNINIAKAFRLFYEKPYAEIYRDIERKQAREINQFIKLHGLDFYTSKKFDKFKPSPDIIQARIRSYLLDIETKRGRLTNGRVTSLTEILINEGYIRSKDVKLYLSGDTNIEDKVKAFEKIRKDVQGSIENIYNFRNNAEGNSSISSIKY